MGAKDGERMGLFGAVLLFAALILFYVIIADVFTVLFRMTGLTEEKARFQVVSLLTNSGYTTRESELVASSKQRRRLARFIMIFGYAFTVTIVSSVVNIFLTMKLVSVENILAALPWPLLLLLLLLYFRKSSSLRRKFDDFISRRADRRMFRQDENHMVLLDEYGSMVIAQGARAHPAGGASRQDRCRGGPSRAQHTRDASQARRKLRRPGGRRNAPCGR